MEKVGSGGGGDVPRGLSLCLVCVFDTQDSGASSWQQEKARGPGPPGHSDPAPWLSLPHKQRLPKVWVGRQLGGDTSIEQRDLPYRQAGSTTGCWESHFRPDRPLPPAGCHQGHCGLPEAPSCPLSPSPALISQRRSWARDPPSLLPPPRT